MLFIQLIDHKYDKDWNAYLSSINYSLQKAEKFVKQIKQMDYLNNGMYLLWDMFFPFGPISVGASKVRLTMVKIFTLNLGNPDIMYVVVCLQKLWYMINHSWKCNLNKMNFIPWKK